MYCFHECGTYYKVQPMFVGSNQRKYWVTWHSKVCHLNYSLSSTYSKHWVILHSQVCCLNYSLICLLTLPIQNVGLYCTHGCCTYYKVQPMFASSTQRIYQVTLHSQVCHLNYSLICLLALPIQNIGLYCTHRCAA